MSPLVAMTISFFAGAVTWWALSGSFAIIRKLATRKARADHLDDLHLLIKLVRSYPPSEAGDVRRSSR